MNNAGGVGIPRPTMGTSTLSVRADLLFSLTAISAHFMRGASAGAGPRPGDPWSLIAENSCIFRDYRETLHLAPGAPTLSVSIVLVYRSFIINGIY